MLCICLSGFELYSRRVPLIKYMLQFRDRNQGFKILHKIFWPCRNLPLDHTGYLSFLKYPQSHGRQKDHLDTTFSTTLTAQRPLIFFLCAINSIRNQLNEDIKSGRNIDSFKRRARREFWASLL